MKRKPFILIAFIVPLILGMGSFGGSESTDKIPATEKKFNAVFIDQMDIATKCSEVSIKGKTYIQGKEGEGLHSIPFESIRVVDITQNNGKLRGVITTRDGKQLTLVIDKKLKAYGRTEFGTFQIDISDLKRIIVSP